MTHEREAELLDLKDRLLDAISKVDRLLCGEDPDQDDVDDEEEPGRGVVDPEDASRKRKQIKPIEYDLAPRRRDVAFKEHP